MRVTGTPLSARFFHRQPRRRNAVTSGDLAPSDAFERPFRVKTGRIGMTSLAVIGAASETRIYAANGKLKKWKFEAESKIPKQANLLRPPPPGEPLNLTVVISVSGHDGKKAMLEYAGTNTYNIKVTYPDGRWMMMRGIERSDPSKREYTTAQDISIPLEGDGTYTIEAWPQGSAGVAGYVSGRRYQLHVGKQNFCRVRLFCLTKVNGKWRQTKAEP